MEDLMFVTDRCVLRIFEEKDLDTFIEYRNNDEWMTYQGFKNLTKDEYRMALLSPLDLENGIQLAIADKMTDALIGDVYLSKEENTISIGYCVHPNYARRGYIIEVLKSLLIKLRSGYPDCEINAMTDKENVASINLLLKLNFVYDQWIEESASEVYVYSDVRAFE
jgi:ribosomal-protein-alanine N-acetyltransferase